MGSSDEREVNDCASVTRFINVFNLKQLFVLYHYYFSFLIEDL